MEFCKVFCPQINVHYNGMHYFSHLFSLEVISFELMSWLLSVLDTWRWQRGADTHRLGAAAPESS